jgi:hypothetical protein
MHFEKALRKEADTIIKEDFRRPLTLYHMPMPKALRYRLWQFITRGRDTVVGGQPATSRHVWLFHVITAPALLWAEQHCWMASGFGQIEAKVLTSHARKQKGAYL